MTIYTKLFTPSALSLLVSHSHLAYNELAAPKHFLDLLASRVSVRASHLYLVPRHQPPVPLVVRCLQSPSLMVLNVVPPLLKRQPSTQVRCRSLRLRLVIAPPRFHSSFVVLTHN